MRYFGALSSKWNVFIEPDLGLKNLCEKGGRWKRQGGWMMLRKLSSRLNRTDADMNSQRLQQVAQDLHKWKPGVASALRGGSGHELPSLIRHYLQLTI